MTVDIIHKQTENIHRKINVRTESIIVTPKSMCGEHGSCAVVSGGQWHLRPQRVGGRGCICGAARAMSGAEEQEGPAEWTDMKLLRTTVSTEQAKKHKNHDSNLSPSRPEALYAHCEKETIQINSKYSNYYSSMFQRGHCSSSNP